MYADENTFFNWIMAPTKSSLPALPPVQRCVLRFLRESRVRFRDGDHGSSLTASDASGVRVDSGVNSAISVGKTTSNVLILTNHQPAI